MVFTELDILFAGAYLVMLSLVVLSPLYCTLTKNKPRNRSSVEAKDLLINSPVDCLIWNKVVSDSDRGMLSTIRVLLERCKSDMETIKQINSTTMEQALALTNASLNILGEVERKMEEEAETESDSSSSSSNADESYPLPNFTRDPTPDISDAEGEEEKVREN